MRCPAPSCPEVVPGIYCPKHREERAAIARAAKEERSSQMKERWENDREGMLAAIARGKAPAPEGE